MRDNVWDYTAHAESYEARPNYADKAIDTLVQWVGAKQTKDFRVADIGAGTANLTLMLVQRGLACIAVEPNEAMRTIGIRRTQGMAVTWKIGTGESTGLDSKSVHWVTFGSSFNTTDRSKTLVETARILKDGGFFTCMWNHRDLEDPFQRRIEDLIRKMAPTYSGGTRRDDQEEVINTSGLFGPVKFVEESQQVTRTPDQYVEAWRSTRNLAIHAGEELFEKILECIRREAERQQTIRLTYTTRAWSAQLK
jgi:ubiquinone/menaquinone biosynthesis C-methylase UbiE